MPTVKPCLGLGLRELVEHRLGLGRVEVLRAEAVAPADHARHGAALAARDAPGPASSPRRDRAARPARPAPWSARAPRSRGTTPAARRGRHRPRTGDRGAPAARRPVRPLACRTAAVSRAVSAPEPISTITRSASAGPSYSNSLYARPVSAGEAVHGGLHDRRRPRVVRVHGLARLEERVRIVRGAADERVLGIERAIPVRAHQILAGSSPGSARRTAASPC